MPEVIDNEQDEVSIDVGSLPDFVSFNSPTFTFDPRAQDAGVHKLNITVEDEHLLFKEYTISVTVEYEDDEKDEGGNTGNPNFIFNQSDSEGWLETEEETAEVVFGFEIKDLSTTGELNIVFNENIQVISNISLIDEEVVEVSIK